MVNAPFFALAMAMAIAPVPAAADPGPATAAPGQAREPAQRQGRADPGRSPDAAFVAKASDATAVDAELATLAATRARTPAVKALAKQVLDGHTALAHELAAMGRTGTVAGASGPEVVNPDPAKGDAAPEAATSDGMKAVAALRAQAPGTFDAAFLAAIVTSREAAVALFEAESRDGRDGEVKEWAARQLPALREQLAAARSLRSRPGASRQVP